MTAYIVKLRFWLRAYDSVEISAATNAEAFHLSKAAARDLMTQAGQPEEIDIEERREGLISYVDQLGDHRCELEEAIVFDGDRPLHPEALQLIKRLAALEECKDIAQVCGLLQSLIAEARAIPTDAIALDSVPPTRFRPWSVEQVYEYHGNPHDIAVNVIDEAGIVHSLDPRLDLRNHSPNGFSWGYHGSGPAQLALAILYHALHSDERAIELYQEFKDDVVSQLDPQQPWRLTTPDILGWVLKHPSTRKNASDD